MMKSWPLRGMEPPDGEDDDLFAGLPRRAQTARPKIWSAARPGVRKVLDAASGKTGAEQPVGIAGQHADAAGVADEPAGQPAGQGIAVEAQDLGSVEGEHQPPGPEARDELQHIIASMGPGSGR